MSGTKDDKRVSLADRIAAMKATRVARAIERERRSRHKKLHKGRGLSYAARVTGAFALTAAMTALIAASILAVVWEGQFQSYTRENMQRLASTTAESLSKNYAVYGSWTSDALSEAASASNLSDGVGVQVLDQDSNILYDNTWSISSGDTETTISLAPNRERTTEASVIVDGEKVGTVRVWAYGSDTVLTQNDMQFRLDSYRALLVAALIAVGLATIVGFIFAKGLVNPIKRITATAASVKEGDRTARTGLHGNDEISQLGETFDEMADSIEKDRELERRLTTDVAHELRTPLMAIQATVEAMQDGVLPVDEERLATVNSETMRLGRLVEALLKLSRLESGSTPFNEEKIDLVPLIYGLTLSHEALLEAAELTLTFESDDEMIVMGDADMIRQATANLISNAARYSTPGGHVTVWVRRSGDMAAIGVSDTGIGIAEDDLQRVFSRFWRADAGRNRASGGLGVGLAVTKEIVDRHHGRIEVRSTLGVGTTFILYIPLLVERTGKSKSGKMRPVK